MVFLILAQCLSPAFLTHPLPCLGISGLEIFDEETGARGLVLNLVILSNQPQPRNAQKQTLSQGLHVG